MPSAAFDFLFSPDPSILRFFLDDFFKSCSLLLENFVMPSMDDSGIPANFARDWFFSDSEVALLLDFVPDFSWRRFNIFSFSRSKSS